MGKRRVEDCNRGEAFWQVDVKWKKERKCAQESHEREQEENKKEKWHEEKRTRKKWRNEMRRRMEEEMKEPLVLAALQPSWYSNRDLSPFLTWHDPVPRGPDCILWTSWGWQRGPQSNKVCHGRTCIRLWTQRRLAQGSARLEGSTWSSGRMQEEQTSWRRGKERRKGKEGRKEGGEGMRLQR